MKNYNGYRGNGISAQVIFQVANDIECDSPIQKPTYNYDDEILT